MTCHAAVEEVPPEALLADDYELQLVHAPLVDTSIPCPHDACDISDGPCTCTSNQDTEPN